MSRWLRKRGLVTGANPQSQAADIYRRLRTNIELIGRDEAIKTIAVASAEPGEGRSTTSANIAIAYAQTSRKVLLLDTDLRSPAQHRIFGFDNDKGLSTVLAGRGEFGEAIRRTDIANLQVVCAGPAPSNPSELLESDAMSELLEAAKAGFDVVIVDTPAMKRTADALIVADKCDGAVLVVRRGKTKMDAALEAKTSLASSRTRVIGAIFNRRGR